MNKSLSLVILASIVSFLTLVLDSFARSSLQEFRQGEVRQLEMPESVDMDSVSNAGVVDDPIKEGGGSGGDSGTITLGSVDPAYKAEPTDIQFSKDK